jgi:hypothetical protein
MPLTTAQRTAVTTRFQTWLNTNRPDGATAAEYVAYLDRLRAIRQATGQSVRGRWDAWYGGLRAVLTAAQRTACENHIDGA